MMLMQSAWLSPLLSALIKRRKIKWREATSMLMIVLGVLVATGLFSGNFQVNLLGIGWGFAAAISYSLMILSTANIARGTRVVDKAKLVTLGGFIASLFLMQRNVDISLFKVDTFWALGNAIFSTILPLILFGYGMPRTSPNLAGMLVTLELPSAYLFSWLLLSESVSLSQILGCVIIILAIIGNSINGEQLRGLLNKIGRR